MQPHRRVHNVPEDGKQTIEVPVAFTLSARDPESTELYGEALP